MNLKYLLLPIGLLTSCSFKPQVLPSTHPVTRPAVILPTPALQHPPAPTTSSASGSRITPAATVIAKPSVKPPPTPPSSLAQGGQHPLKYQDLTSGGVSFHIVSYNNKTHYLKLADQKSIGRQWTSAKRAADSLGGVAAINGGFFTESGKPLGLVKSNGKQSGTWNTSSSLASGVYQYSNGTAQLVRNRSANKGAHELLQTGPFLVENGKAVSGLSQKRIAQRSILLWDGKNHMALAVTSPCTLAELASAIKTLPSTVPHYTALNLDGGRSTDFYVSSQVKNGNVTKGHWLRSQVRNYLVLKPVSH